MIIIKIFKHLKTKSYTITLKTEIKPFYGKKKTESNMGHFDL